MSTCEQCIFFRPVKLASELLRQAINTTDAAVSNALIEIRKDENSQRDNEAQERVMLQQTYDEKSGQPPVWGHRPVMSAYCGLQENEGMYIVSQIKNLGGRCKDFTPGTPVQNRSCNTCVHRVKAQGVSSDQQMLVSRLDMITSSITFGVSPSLPQDQLKNFNEGIAPQKSFEITQAYHTQGMLQSEPKYLDYCAKFTQERGAYVVCTLHNRHNTCNSHKSF